MSSLPVKSDNTGFHNYYHPNEFFTHEKSEGAIYLRDSQRAARAGESFVVGLHQGLEEEVGEAGGLVMYSSGYNWGVEDMRRFSDRMRQEFGGGKTDIWNMNPRFVFESWWWPFTTQGFGSWTLDLDFQKKDLSIVEIRNSAVAQSMELSGKPVCYLYAGLFAGVFSVFERTERESIEVQCYSMGSESCKFVIGDKKKVDAVEFWKNEGASAAEIADNLSQV